MNLLNYFSMMLKILGITLFPGIYMFPFAFYQSGVVLSIITILTVIFITIAVTTLQIEAIAIFNSLKREEKDFINTVKNSLEDDNTSDEDSKNEYLNEDRHEEVEVIQISSYSNINVKEEQDNFFIRRKFEICELADKTLNEGKSKQKILVKLLVFVYYFIWISLAISFTSDTLYNYFNTRDSEKFQNIPHFIFVLIVLTITIFSAIASQIKCYILLKIIYIVNYVFVFVFLSELIYMFTRVNLMDKFSYTLVNSFEIKEVNSLFGVCLFSFSLFPYLPSLIENFSPQRKFFSILVISLLFGFGIILLFSFMGLLLFTNILVCDDNVFPSALKLNIITNFVNINGIADIISLFQALNIFQIGYYINRLKSTKSSIIPKFIYQYVNKQTNSSKSKFEWFRVFAFTIVLLIPSTILSIFVPLKILINYLIVLVGFFLVSVVFIILISNARKKIVNYEVPKGKMHVSFLKNKLFMTLFCLILVTVFCFIIISITGQDNRDCIAQYDYDDFFD